MNSTDRRGEILEEVLASNGLVVLNVGLLPTFVRGDGDSWYIDITTCDEWLGERVSSWRTRKNLSLHKYVETDIMRGRKELSKARGWRWTKIEIKSMRRKVREEIEKGLGHELDELYEVIKGCKREGKRGNMRVRRANYWWNEEIEELWRECKKE